MSRRPGPPDIGKRSLVLCVCATNQVKYLVEYEKHHLKLALAYLSHDTSGLKLH